MGRAKKRADRIRELVPLDGLLENYGYDVVAGADREQQFSCDLHGDGSDNKPSARYYPDSSSWYCFACSRSRDAITTVMEKEGVPFGRACTLLEQQHGLPALPWEQDEDEDGGSEPHNIVESAARPGIKEAVKSVHKVIDHLVQEREIGFDQALRFWEAYDRVVTLSASGALNDTDAMRALARIQVTALRKGA